MQMRHHIFRFILFWIITGIVYRNAWGNQFIDDFLTGYVEFEERGWLAMVDSLGFTSLYYGKDLISLSFYEVFGLNKWAWWLLFTGMHALNAFLGSGFIQNILERNQINHARLISSSGALLFLLSPYQTENVVWGATMHYGISMILMWLGFFLYSSFLETKKLWQLVLFYFVFAYSLLTLEISLVFPGLYFMVFAFLWNSSFNRNEFIGHITRIVFPMGVMIILYFIATKIIKGVFIGHYGSETHANSLLSFAAAGTCLQYFTKLFGYIHFLGYTKREAVYEFLKNPVVIISFYSIIVVLLFYFFKKHKRNTIMAGILFVMSLICLLPVSNMYFMYLNEVENARLSYFASYFAFTLLALLLSFIGKKILFVSVVVFSCLNIYLLKDIINRWEVANEIQYNALATFQWENSEKVFILNQPCYYKGVYVFRNRTRFIRALKFFKKQNLQEQIMEVAWTNRFALTDNVAVEALNNTDVKVTLNEWGRWFWVNGIGASNYSTDYFSVEFDEWNHSYVVHFKKPINSNEAVIYYTPEGWKKVDMKL